MFWPEIHHILFINDTFTIFIFFLSSSSESFPFWNTTTLKANQAVQLLSHLGGFVLLSTQTATFFPPLPNLFFRHWNRRGEMTPAHKAGTSEQRRTLEQRAAASPPLNIEQPFALAGGRGGEGGGEGVGRCSGEFREGFLAPQIREPNKMRIALMQANWQLIVRLIFDRLSRIFFPANLNNHLKCVSNASLNPEIMLKSQIWTSFYITQQEKHCKHFSSDFKLISNGSHVNFGEKKKRLTWTCNML